MKPLKNSIKMSTVVPLPFWQKIAREKAGILKPGIPGFTVDQPPDALEALQDCAAKASTSLTVVPSLESLRLDEDGPSSVASVMSLGGSHMLINAGRSKGSQYDWQHMIRK